MFALHALLYRLCLKQPQCALTNLSWSFLTEYRYYRYFTQNVEIAWGKEMRGTYDHTGLSTAKADSHTRRLLYPGMRERNKHNIKIFPFNFVPMNDIAEKRKIDYPDME